MSQSVVTTRIDIDLAAKLDAMARTTKRSRSWHTARALESYVEREGAYLAFIQVGIDEIERGEFLTEEEADRFFDEMLMDLPTE